VLLLVVAATRVVSESTTEEQQYRQYPRFDPRGVVKASEVTISNVDPRKDVTGSIMDIHDGNTLLLSDGLYYYYGASYGSCQEPQGDSGCADAGMGNCGFRLDHNVSLWTSPDLATWTPAPNGPVFQMAHFPVPGILFCPKVIFNEATNLFVLWFNWIGDPAFKESYYAVATAPSPFGPFELVHTNVTMGEDNTGDFNLFLDDNGAGYIIYTSHITYPAPNHLMSVEQLSWDFLSTTGLNHSSGFFGDSFVEAPAMFKRDGTYYAVFGSCCCYCKQGSPVYAYSAPSALGPYTKLPTPITGAIPGQQTNIAPFVTADGVEYMWQGDRWQSSPDGEKGHDFSYWGPLTWSNTSIQALDFLNSFTLNMPSSTATH